MANGGENMVIRRREQTQGLIYLARISSPVTQPSQGRLQKWIRDGVADLSPAPLSPEVRTTQLPFVAKLGGTLAADKMIRT
jgi:hypothetical protein